MRVKLQIRFLFVLFLLNYSAHLFGQSDVYMALDDLRKNELKELKTSLTELDTTTLAYKAILWQFHFLNTGELNDELIAKIELDTIKIKDQFQKSISYLTLGDYYLHQKNKIDSIPIKLYTFALRYGEKNNDKIIITESLKRLFLYYISPSTRNYYLESFERDLKTYGNYLYDTHEYLENAYYTIFYKIAVYDSLKEEEKLSYRVSIDDLFFESIKESKKVKEQFLTGKLIQLFGVKSFHLDKNYKQADSLYQEAIRVYEGIPYFFVKAKLYGLYMNRGSTFHSQGDYVKSKELLHKAAKVVTQDNEVSVNRWLRDVCYALGEIDSVHYYSEKRFKAYKELETIKHSKAVSELEKKYKNAELRAEKATINTQLYVSLFLLALVIISAYLLQKNTRKKQLLAEQAKDLEAQKVSTLLKEQELASIDAMIEGQEKERKRIAEDLHDDLGALMATVKLHFDNIETAQNEDAVQKTSSLLDEAYSKIRTIAHAKNAGVIANEGLLVAVKNMTSKISSANKIDMEVIAHGLENRLENSLELSLFRTIQELIANIIKHAEATKATIQLTQFEESLNIIVEDNGKGFHANTIKETGIGLDNIKKRIKHLKGTFSIDSTLGRGTTILIDIPLKS